MTIHSGTRASTFICSGSDCRTFCFWQLSKKLSSEKGVCSDGFCRISVRKSTCRQEWLESCVIGGNLQKGFSFGTVFSTVQACTNTNSLLWPRKPDSGTLSYRMGHSCMQNDNTWPSASLLTTTKLFGCRQELARATIFSYLVL